MFNAVYIDRTGNELQVDVRQLPESALPEGDVTVQISHSTLNYKDAMAITGQGGAVVRSFPMVPGIDLAGTVLASADPAISRVTRSFSMAGAWVNGTGVGFRRWRA